MERSSQNSSPELGRGDALLIVDVQNDFCPGGALAIEGGNDVVPVLNDWIAAASRAGVPVFASRDWHPAGHISFKERGGPWPPHCLQDSHGAAFHAELALPADVIKVTKGNRFDQDQNSAFEQTGLSEELRTLGVTRLWVGGLAEDVCVRATLLDARRAGFDTRLIIAATRPVTQEGGAKARAEIAQAGVALA